MEKVTKFMDKLREKCLVLKDSVQQIETHI